MSVECDACDSTGLVAMFPDARVESLPIDPMADFWARLHDTVTVCSYARALEVQAEIAALVDEHKNNPQAPIPPAAWALASSRVVPVTCQKCQRKDTP